MSEISLMVKGYQFIHPKENVTTSQFIQNSKNKSDFRLKAAANLLFATLLNLGNTAYYTTSMVLGTVKRFPTEGKKEAKNFLNAEGLKALNTAIYAATTALLTVASLYNPKWALSHLEIKQSLPLENGEDAAMTPEEYRRKFEIALLEKDHNFQILFVLIKNHVDIERQNECQEQTNYHDIFMERYEEDFADPENVDTILEGMKKILAAIAFMRDYPDLADLVQEEYAGAQIELFEEKEAYNVQREEERETQRLQREGDRLLIEEQNQAFQAAAAVDRRNAEEVLLKESQEEALGVIEHRLDQHLESLNVRLENFAGIRSDLVRNCQQTQIRALGQNALDAEKIFEFVLLRVRDVNLEEIDLAEVQEFIVPTDLRDSHYLAGAVFFDRITATHKEVQEKTEEINNLIDYAGLILLKNDFPPVPTKEQKAQHGRDVIKYLQGFSVI